MDFIILPDDVAAHDPVPDLGGPNFDNQGFKGYDERQGWNVTALRNGDILAACNNWGEYSLSVFKDTHPEHLPEDGEAFVTTVAGSFIQTWILFGILQEALRRPVFRHEVLRTVTSTDSDGKPIVSRFITVRHLFAEFMSKGHELNVDSSWANHLDQCLRDAAGILGDLDLVWEAIGGSVIPTVVHLALSSLVVTLRDQMVIFRRRHHHMARPDVAIPLCQPFERKLLEDRRWCPSMVQRICTQFGPDGLYYASLIPGFGTGQQHSKCDSRVCVASNIDRDKYYIRHVASYCSCQKTSCDHTTPECLCPQVSVRDDELRAALEDGGFPLIMFQEGGIQIVKSQPENPYIAISHVWSDGRGNPGGNSLPQCQLQSIYQYVTAISANSKNSLFWMDTLCVPIREPLRNTAVMRMAQVYSSASHVLVLSKDLLSNNLPSTPDQALFWIYCSQWMTRLWTMQEASLAGDLVFQFADKYIKQRTLDEEIMQATLNTGDQSRQIGWKANHGLDSVMSIQQSTNGGKTFPIIGIWKGLRHRSTSRILDVAICGSILLGSADNLNRVLSAPNDRKMQTFWLCQELVPASLLWVSGPRLRCDGFRWAPSNLLHPETSSLPPDENSPAAEPTSNGLLVTSIEGWILKNFLLPNDESVVLRFLLPNTQQRYLCCKVKSDENETWAEVQHLWKDQCALLLPQFSSNQTRNFAALVIPTALDVGDQCEDETAPILARYFARVVVFLENSLLEHGTLEVNDGLDALRSVIKRGDFAVSDIADSRCIEASRQWCIF